MRQLACCGLVVVVLAVAGWAWGQTTVPAPAWEPLYQQLSSLDGTTRQRTFQQMVDLLFRQLQDADKTMREQATVRLRNLPGDALPVVEAAMKQNGTSPEVQMRVEPALSILRKRAVITKMAEQRLRWRQAHSVEAYRQMGHRDPRWDKAAEEGIRLYFMPTADTTDTAIRTALNSAVQAGCDDALVLYCHARIYGRDPGFDPKELGSRYQHAAQAMDKSKYPASHRILAYLEYANVCVHLPAFAVDVQRAFDLVSCLPEVAKEPEITAEDVYQVAQRCFEICQALEHDRKKAFDRVYAALDQALPGSPLPLVFKGTFYHEYAWEARGNGWANTVNEEGWRLMKERLGVAEQALQEAMQRDPNDWRAPRRMINVELGQGKGRNTMEKWFKLAMDNNPDNLDACQEKLYYLEPKWYGDEKEMLEFGRQLLAEENWMGELPFVLVRAHEKLAAYESNRDAYFQKPEVWEDIRTVFERYLTLYPWQARARSRFASWACTCGQWQEAKKQLEILGDRVQVAEFGGKASYEYERRRVERMTGAVEAR